MGVFEFPAFAEGTVAIARVVADLDATTIIGGGGFRGCRGAGRRGGPQPTSPPAAAPLEFAEGKELPGVAALQDK